MSGLNSGKTACNADYYLSGLIQIDYNCVMNCVIEMSEKGYVATTYGWYFHLMILQLAAEPPYADSVMN